jgi:hypothetical protein
MPESPESENQTAWTVRTLEPGDLRLFRTGGDSVRATIRDTDGTERTWLRVQLARAFPLRDPEHWIGLRDSSDNDIGMLRSLEGMDSESQSIAREELERRYFLPRVTGVRKVKREVETITWEVDTDKGPRTVHVQNLRDSVRELGQGRILITDRSGNRIEFPSLANADKETRAVLSRVLSSTSDID